MLPLTEFTALLENPDSRRERYAEMLPAFYAIATDPYRANWAESFHLPPFRAGETLAQAVARQEQHLARVAGLRTGTRVLDLGCGVGGPAMSVAEYSGAHVTGLNIVAAHVGIATEEAARRGLSHLCEFTVGDMMDLPFEDGSFDAAFSFDAICHVPDKPRVYREVARVLKPGGVFLGADWLCADGLTRAEYDDLIEPVCVYAALPSVIPVGEMVRGLVGAGFVLDDYGNLAERGDMTPNWELFEEAAGTIPAPRDPAREVMLQHCLSTARAGRSGKFLVGSWTARKAADALPGA